MKTLLQFVVASFVILPTVAFSAQPEQNAFEFEISNSTLDQLTASATRYRSGKPSSGVALQIHTHLGINIHRFQPIDIRSDNYVSEVTTSSGLTRDDVQVELFQAEVEPGGSVDFVRLGIITESRKKTRRVSGFLRAGGAYYQLAQPEPRNQTVLASRLSKTEIGRIAKACGVETPLEAAHVDVTSPGFRTEALAAETATFKRIEIATEADYKFVTSLGSESSANADILVTLAGVDAIFRSQLGLTLQVTYQHAWNVPDPYSTSYRRALVDFSDYWEAHFRLSHHYDLAHLFTGNDYGAVLGIAWVGTVCSASTVGYAISATESWAREFDVIVTAHELGHNLGADHDTSGTCEGIYLMCPTVGSTNSFSPNSLLEINSYLSTVTCLDEVTGEIPPVTLLPPLPPIEPPNPENPQSPIPNPNTPLPDVKFRVKVADDNLKFEIANSAACRDVQIIAAKQRSALQNRTDYSTLGHLVGSANTIRKRSANLPQYDKGRSNGSIYFDLSCDGTPLNLIRRIKTANIKSSEKTKTLASIIHQLALGFRE